MQEQAGPRAGFDAMAQRLVNRIGNEANLAAPALLSLVALGVWIALASARPTATFHFAPLIIGSVPAAMSPAPRRPLMAVAGAVTAIAASIGLAVNDLLRGPTFVSESGAIYEALLFAVVGAALGWRFGRHPSDNAS